VTSLLTAEEVAQRLGVTKHWVWEQARADRIPHLRLGRHLRFREEAIDAWLIELESTGSTRNASASSLASSPRLR
jgi:excisionase family DNA binding protein